MPSLQVRQFTRALRERTLIPLGDAVIIGRDPSCGVIIPVTSVSREHARISRAGGGHVIEDLGSRGGTWLNLAQISGPTPLRDGDQIRICDFVATFYEDAPPRAAGPARAAWEGGADPDRMLETLERAAGGRKARLFAAACCRRIGGPLLDRPHLLALGAFERSADGLCSEEELSGERASLWGGWEPGVPYDVQRAAAAVGVVLDADYDHPFGGAKLAASKVASTIEDLGRGRRPSPLPDASDVGPERLAQCALLRDVFGNPFRPVSLDATRQTPTAFALARAAYDERHLPSGELDPQRLGVLADALEEAGAPGELVAHLRGPGPHVRGCWVIDAILQKE